MTLYSPPARLISSARCCVRRRLRGGGGGNCSALRYDATCDRFQSGCRGGIIGSGQRRPAWSGQWPPSVAPIVSAAGRRYYLRRETDPATAAAVLLSIFAVAEQERYCWASGVVYAPPELLSLFRELDHCCRGWSISL